MGHEQEPRARQGFAQARVVDRSHDRLSVPVADTKVWCGPAGATARSARAAAPARLEAQLGGLSAIARPPWACRSSSKKSVES